MSVLIIVGTESFPCLVCCLHFGFNKGGARINFPMSYIIYLECIDFSSGDCLTILFSFGICLGVSAYLSSQRIPSPSSFSQGGEPFIEEE